MNIRTLVQQYSSNVIRNVMFGSRYFGKGNTDGGPRDEEIEHIDSLLTVLGYVYSFCVTDYLLLRPVAPFNLPHVSLSDTVVAGYFIPKGSHVLLSRPGLGRNLDVSDDPLTFNPDLHMNHHKEVVLTDHNLLKFGVIRLIHSTINNEV
ncbi:hypothetical protein L2E82_19560 [Cichorium intybus]|uniref:Uncharacterized protein n=1 Tax=Cichorium intybus TaxID=13427 RepID=A0ACB9FCY6_CICIN|nr:hypothetical protein L2E82_19560 [Cichorium intybus]